MRLRRGMTAAAAALALDAGSGSPAGIGAPVHLGSVSQLSDVAAAASFTVGSAVGAGGDVLIATYGSTNNEATSIADTAGNTYTALNLVELTARPIRFFHSKIATPLTTSDTITVTWAGAAGTKLAVAASIAGLAASPVDGNGAGATGAFVAPSTSPPTITTGTLAQPNEIVVGMVSVSGGDGDPFTEATGFTSMSGVSTPLAAGSSLHWAYRTVASTAPVTYAPILGTSRTWVVNYVTLKGV